MEKEIREVHTAGICGLPTEDEGCISSMKESSLHNPQHVFTHEPNTKE